MNASNISVTSNTANSQVLTTSAPAQVSAPLAETENSHARIDVGVFDHYDNHFGV